MARFVGKGRNEGFSVAPRHLIYPGTIFPPRLTLALCTDQARPFPAGLGVQRVFSVQKVRGQSGRGRSRRLLTSGSVRVSHTSQRSDRRKGWGREGMQWRNHSRKLPLPTRIGDWAQIWAVCLAWLKVSSKLLAPILDNHRWGVLNFHSPVVSVSVIQTPEGDGNCRVDIHACSFRRLMNHLEAFPFLVTFGLPCLISAFAGRGSRSKAVSGC